MKVILASEALTACAKAMEVRTLTPAAQRDLQAIYQAAATIDAGYTQAVGAFVSNPAARDWDLRPRDPTIPVPEWIAEYVD
jgi:hypothetical protein